MRFLDQQLDDVLERAYELLQPRPTRIGAPGREGPDLRRLARLQLDGAILFEQVTNALKLVGDQYLARVYSLASRRFHLGEWDASITRDRKSTRLNSSHGYISYAVFCLKKKKT